MKLAIIGAGNMGGAIARGLSRGGMIAPEEIFVSNPSKGKLDSLKEEIPGINVTTLNREAGHLADILIIAVKPYLVEKVLREINPDRETILVSVAAGVSFDTLGSCVQDASMPMFRVVPNIAAKVLESMNVISSRGASSDQIQFIVNMFSATGLSIYVKENDLDAGTAISSCGIAYVLKYIQAATQAGVQMGLTAEEAMKMAAQSAKGAAEILLKEDSRPSVEIEKVCTPGGLTIKGLNSLENDRFSAAVINAMLHSCK